MNNENRSCDELILEINNLKSELDLYRKEFDNLGVEIPILSSNSIVDDNVSFSKIYHNVIANLPIPAYLVNSKGYFVGCNIPFEGFVEKTLVEIVGSTPDKIFPREIGKRSIYSSKKEQNLMDFATHDIVNIRKAEEIRTVIISESVYKDSKDEPLGILGVFNDITEKTKADRKLRESEQKTRELDHIKDQFFHIVSHDLKSPFSALLGFSQMLVEEYETLDEEDKKTFIEQIYTTANFSFKLLTNLQLWSKVTLNKVTVNREVIELNLVIVSCLKKFRQECSRKQIALNVSVDPLHLILADKTMLEIIFENLISNAVKFVGKGGNINIVSKLIDDNLHINISDNGLGLSKEDQGKLFKIEIHTVKIGTKKAKGTGLGLVLCKLLTEKNNGTISLKSKLGEGTTVSLVFPQFKKSERANNV